MTEFLNVWALGIISFALLYLICKVVKHYRLSWLPTVIKEMHSNQEWLVMKMSSNEYQFKNGNYILMIKGIDFYCVESHFPITKEWQWKRMHTSKYIKRNVAVLKGKIGRNTIRDIMRFTKEEK